MSQRNVEMVVGRLVTDEGFRRRFAAAPRTTIQELIEGGLDLNPCESRALSALDANWIERFAQEIDPCIQKIEIEGDRPC